LSLPQTGLYLLIELGGLTAGDGRRLPLGVLEMFGEENDLPAMVGVVSNLPINGLDD
jgi:hypothetical protein